MPIQLTRRSTFCAAHRLHSPHLSDEENRRVYGKCNNPHGHGHNYALDVTVEGDPDPLTGMLINLFELDEIIEREIIQHVDHRNMNADVSIMEGVIPTIENMAMRFWDILEPCMPDGVRLARIYIQETSKNSVTYTGPNSTRAAF